MMSSQKFTYKQYSRTEELPANSPENAGPETQHRLNIITKSFYSYKKKNSKKYSALILSPCFHLIYKIP